MKLLQSLNAGAAEDAPHVGGRLCVRAAADDFEDEERPRGAESLELLHGWEVRLHHAADSSRLGPRQSGRALERRRALHRAWRDH